MSEPMERDEILELLPAYVLGALEPDEMLHVAQYVERDPELRERVAELEDATAQLAFSAPTVALPSAAKAQLMARARASLPAQAAAQPTVVVPPSGGLSHAPTSRLKAALQRLLWPALGGALAATLAFVVFYVVPKENELRALETVIAQLQQQQAQNLQALAPLADRTIPVPGTTIAPTASGTFYLRGEQGVLVAQNLQPLAPSQTYQFWLVLDGQPTSFGLLERRPDGSAVLPVTVPPDAQDFTIVDVSIERAGGSPEITREAVVLRGTVN